MYYSLLYYIVAYYIINFYWLIFFYWRLSATFSDGRNRLTRVRVKKVKFSRYKRSVAQRVGRGIALLFHDRGTRRGWVVSSTLRPHFTPGKDLVPILQEAGWAPWPVLTGRKSRPHRYSIPERPARDQSLYRLSYPAHTWVSIWKAIIQSLMENTVLTLSQNKNVARPPPHYIPCRGSFQELASRLIYFTGYDE